MNQVHSLHIPFNFTFFNFYRQFKRRVLLHRDEFSIFQPTIRSEYCKEMAKNKFMAEDCKFLLNTQTVILLEC